MRRTGLLPGGVRRFPRHGVSRTCRNVVAEVLTISEQLKPITIVDVKGPTSIHIEVRIAEDTGAVVLAGQDLGEAPQEHFGKSDYEYFLSVPAVEKDRLLLELLAEKLRGNTSARTALADWLSQRGIRFELASF